MDLAYCLLENVVSNFVLLFLGAINGLAVSNDGELACTVGDDKTAKIFDIINFGEQNCSSHI